MADEETEIKILSVLRGIVQLLAMSIPIMEEVIGKPNFLDGGTVRRRFRYSNPNALTFQVLMCVRVVSALDAALILLRHAHTTEMGVLFRTIDDFIAEIGAFVDEAVEKGMNNVTVAQREYLATYFIDDSRTTEELLRDRPKINYNQKRQKVQAAESRQFGGDNPDRVKRNARAIDDGWNGVVHGSYSSVMEMYGGDTLDSARFHVDGMPERYCEYRHYLGLLLHAALNAFFKVSYNLGLLELATKLRDMRREFEGSTAYTSA